ncbi:MAG: fused MFS/spermidine synthase [bacterium]
MVFFQATLLLGYLYAHYSIRLLGLRRQSYVHAALHIVALAWLPFALSVSDSDWEPWQQVAKSLALGIGVPFFVLSSNAPTLQRWYAASNAPDRDNPYRLYAASNIGSLLALLGYPILVEPWLGISQQAVAWTGGFALLIVGIAASTRVIASDTVSDAAQTSSSTDWRTRLKWLGWAAVPSSLLLGCTTFLTSDVAALPLLWVLPLAAYLATFIFAFAARRVFSTQTTHQIAFVLTLIVAVSSSGGVVGDAWLAIPLHLVTLFAVALAFHQSLVDARPAANDLTEFYVWMSLGGVLGGAFNAFVAPEIFNRPFEYPLALAIAMVVVGTKIPRLAFGRANVVTVGVLVVAVEAVLFGLGTFSNSGTMYAVALAVAGAVPLVLWFGQPMLGIHSVAILFVVFSWRPFDTNLLERIRSPYGIYRVAQSETELGPQNTLFHGRIIHGAQMRTDDLDHLPGTYYSLRSPIGQTFDVLARTRDTRPVGLIGLGVGTLATYAQRGQVFDFFEIDPVVAELAQNPDRFSFIENSAGTIHVKVGDGRKLLEREANGKYRMLVLDAYSSDSVPVHLLTREALQLYMDHTTPDGWLLFHCSNKYIDVQQIVINAAASLGWASLTQVHWPRESHDVKMGVTASDWVAVARTPADLAPLKSAQSDWKVGQPNASSVWTDDYANILPYWR